MKLMSTLGIGHLMIIISLQNVCTHLMSWVITFYYLKTQVFSDINLKIGQSIS